MLYNYHIDIYQKIYILFICNAYTFGSFVYQGPHEKRFIRTKWFFIIKKIELRSNKNEAAKLISYLKEPHLSVTKTKLIRSYGLMVLLGGEIVEKQYWNEWS